MSTPHIVIDTSVWIAALRSKRGASYKLLNLVSKGQFEIHISVPLVLEYEAVAKRMLDKITLVDADVNAIINYLCAVAHHERIFYLWRPFLPDADDDMALELAVTSRCQYIVTYNIRDFKGLERFGVQAIRPGEFLEKIGVRK